LKKFVLLGIALVICITICTCTDSESEISTSPGNVSNSVSNSPEGNIQNSDEGREVTVDNQELSNFDDLDDLPSAITQHSLTDITKILSYEHYDMQRQNGTAIDIQNKNLYTEPEIGYIRLAEPDYNMTDEDVETVLNILDKYDVLNWDSTYGEKPDDDPDNVMDGDANWYLYIQYSDGTVSGIQGYGRYSESYPEGAESFMDEMIAFTYSKKDV